MSTAPAGLNLGAAHARQTASGGQAPAKADAARQAQDKPRFDQLMEEKAAEKTARAKPAQPAGKRADKPAPEAEAPAAKPDGKSERAARKPQASEDWPPAGLVSLTPTLVEPAPVSPPLEPVVAAQSQSPVEAGSIEISAAVPAMPALDAAAAVVLTAADGAGALGALGEAAPAIADALAAEPPLPVADAQAVQAAPAEATNTARPALQNLLSFAGHLASGNAIAAAPEAVALIKDAVDALRSDGEGEPATPTTNAMAAPATASPNGLARTATVNPLEAPMPDLHNEQFDEAVGTRLTWMAEQKIGHAHIKLSPGDLGAVEVRLRLDGDRVHADFSSAQPEVRQALENSLPKLRDMLGQHGFQLAQADVGHRQDSRSSPDTPASADRAGGEGSFAAESEPLLPRPVRVTAHGLLDAYA